jgi:hypothetical protein
MNAPQEQGGMRDAMGRFVPDTLIKPIDRLRHDLVCELVLQARRESEALKGLKVDMLGQIEAFVELSAERYGAVVGGHKGNLTLMSFDGRFKIQRQIQEHLVFDERLQVAKSLIDDCITEWSEGSSVQIRALVEHAFRVNQEGKVSTTSVLGLRRLDITDPKWLKAMQAISDSVQCAGSKTYVRIYERIGDTDAWRPISLDFSGV